jgi:hypothetical protein
MRTIPRVVVAALGLGAGVALGACARSVASDASTLRGDLEVVAQRRIFFGHQSVGENVLEGLRRLAAREGVALRIVEAGSAAAVPAATFGHGRMAANGQPSLKLRSFRAALDAGAPGDGDVALLKFCYVDFTGGTDVAGLFAEYQATMAELKGRHPRTTFVHVTAPLVAVPGGVRQSLRSLLGRPPPPQIAGNARRDEFNALLRRAYGGREPVFDLARIESTRPDGTAETVEWQGRSVPAMVGRYTDDGGHLNAEGQLRVAGALAAALAAIPPVPERRRE